VAEGTFPTFLAHAQVQIAAPRVPLLCGRALTRNGACTAELGQIMIASIAAGRALIPTCFGQGPLRKLGEISGCAVLYAESMMRMRCLICLDTPRSHVQLGSSLLCTDPSRVCVSAETGAKPLWSASAAQVAPPAYTTMTNSYPSPREPRQQSPARHDSSVLPIRHLVEVLTAE